MSPEQAKGLDADHRSDIFSFGCIFYELLSGRRAFEGDTASESLASVLKSDVDLSRLPPDLNPRLVDVLRRCLEKDPKQRWHSAADVRLQIEDAIDGASIVDHRARDDITIVLENRGDRRRRRSRRRPCRGLRRVDAQAGARTCGDAILISAAGGPAVHACRPNDPGALPRWHKPRLRRQPPPLPSSDVGFRVARDRRQRGARRVQSPVFSPDGQWVAFRSVGDGTLKRLPISGGAPVTICPSEALFGMSWSEEGLLFGQYGKGILRVSPDGGVPEVLVPVSADETADAPQMLPGGKAILFSVKKLNDTWDEGAIVVHSFAGGTRKTVVDGGSAALYVPTGHLVYAVASVLFAVPFSLDSQAVSGGAVSIVEGIDRGLLGTGPGRSATAHYTFSSTGSLMFVPGSRASATEGRLDLALFDRKAGPQALGLPPGLYAAPRVSPDGKWAAVEREEGSEANIWLAELAGTSVLRRLTFGGKNRAPVWSGDSQWVAFQSDRDGDAGIFRQRADGSGTAERLTTPETGAAHIPQSSSRDGAHLLFTVIKDGQVLVVGPADEGPSRVSVRECAGAGARRSGVLTRWAMGGLSGR